MIPEPPFPAASDRRWYPSHAEQPFVHSRPLLAPLSSSLQTTMITTPWSCHARTFALSNGMAMPMDVSMNLAVGHVLPSPLHHR